MTNNAGHEKLLANRDSFPVLSIGHSSPSGVNRYPSLHARWDGGAVAPNTRKCGGRVPPLLARIGVNEVHDVHLFEV